MSKGLGKIERKILKAFKEDTRSNETSLIGLCDYMEGLIENLHDDSPLNSKFSHSIYMSTYRAVKSLERKGYVETYVKYYGMFSWPYAKGLKVKYKC